MNKYRRQCLEKCKRDLENILALKDELVNELEYIRDEEQEAYDNMPEQFQNSERGEIMSSNIDLLDAVIDKLGEYEDLTYDLEEIE